MFNQIILIGNLGQNPESRALPSGKTVCNFSIATSETWKDQAGVKQEKTTWHQISLFGRLGEVAQQYLSKGSKVMVVGKLSTRDVRGEDGRTTRYYSVIGNEMKMLGSRPHSATPPLSTPAAVQNSVEGIDPLPF